MDRVTTESAIKSSLRLSAVRTKQTWEGRGRGRGSWALTVVSPCVGLWQVLQCFLLSVSILRAGCCPLSQSGHNPVVWQRWLVKLVFCEKSHSWCCSLPRLRLSREGEKKKCQDIHLSCTSANLSLTLKLAATAPL